MNNVSRGLFPSQCELRHLPRKAQYILLKHLGLPNPPVWRKEDHDGFKIWSTCIVEGQTPKGRKIQGTQYWTDPSRIVVPVQVESVTTVRILS